MENYHMSPFKPNTGEVYLNNWQGQTSKTDIWCRKEQTFSKDTQSATCEQWT